jgi:hypothetical protein
MNNRNTSRHGAVRTPLSIATSILLIVPVLGVGAATAPRPARSPSLLHAASRSTAASVFESDKGTFRIAVNGQQVGKEEFEIAANGANWMARGTTDIQSPKGATHITGTLVLRPDGTPVHYEWSTQGARKASAKVDFDGPTATIELHVASAKPFTQQFTFQSPRIAVLDNNLYDQFAVLAHLYDWSKKGAQTFPVLVPQEMTPGTATVESLGKQDANGKELGELRVTTEDNQIDLYLDGSRLVRISVPSANAEIVRE